jgi:hypothetical protein
MGLPTVIRQARPSAALAHDGLQSVFERSGKPVRVKKTRQIKNLEPRFDSIEADKGSS